MASKFKRLLPTLNRILVRKFEQETKTASGIILNEASDKTSFGEIVEVGPGKYTDSGNLIPTIVQKGQIVVLPDYGGHKVEIDGKEFFIYRDSDIAGIVEK